MRQTKTYWRWRMAERLAKRIYAEPTESQVDEANDLVWRLCRLANDNERNCERDNDERWMLNPYRRAKLERIEERWLEREKEINGLFAKYGCSIYWPGLYPSIKDAEGHDIDIWEMY